MGTIARFTSMPRMMESLNGHFLYLNDLDPVQDAALISKLTVTSYDSSTYSMIPSCHCGTLNKREYPEANIGDVCHHCCTEMRPPNARRLTPHLWVRKFDQIRKLILPVFISNLVSAYKVTGHSVTVIHWLLNPHERHFNVVHQREFLEANGVERGINYFVDNADRIMELLSTPDVFGGTPNQQQVALVYHQNKDRIFVDALPLTDKSFNVIERTHLGNYLDVNTFNPYMSAINLVTGMYRSRRANSIKSQESVTAQVLFRLAEYHERYIINMQNGKGGEYRKGVYASRMPWTTRQLISSITTPHDYDEVHMPWSAMIPLLEHHLMNHMFKDGYHPMQARSRLLRAVNNYDEYIDELFQRIINESPHRTVLSGKPGLILLDNRNPTLNTSSIQQVICTRIKTDPLDITCSRSVLTLPGQNGDFN